MVIFLKGALEVLDYFVEDMARGSDALVLNLKNAEESIRRLLELDSKIDNSTVVITFNNVGTNLVLGGSNYWKQKKVRLFNILVDHPVYYVSEILRDYYLGYHVVCIDEGHADFLKKFLPEPEKSVLFVPHGGVGGFASPLENRGIDVLYVGGFHKEETINFPIVPGVDSELFYEKIIDYYAQNDYVEVCDAVTAFMDCQNIAYDTETFITLSYYAICTVENYNISSRRFGIIEALAQNGIKVTVCGGDCWDELAERYPDSIEYMGMVSSERCIELIGKSKILINDLPYFSRGAHERIFNGMLNNTLVVSNQSSYLEGRFEEGKDIVYWDGKDVSSMISKIEYYLKNTEERETIIENASLKVQNDLWKDRFFEILSFND